MLVAAASQAEPVTKAIVNPVLAGLLESSPDGLEEEILHILEASQLAMYVLSLFFSKSFP
jgi:hypothetical protein